MTKKPTRLSLRIDLPDGSRLGPGKAQLLSEIEVTGSIAGAARSLGMSYPRALRLVKEMNVQFTTELIEKYQGGSSRGGAALTEAGKSVLGIYRNIEAESAKAAVLSLKKLRKMTRS